MNRKTILSFHFPHKTGSMFGYEVLKRIASITDSPLYSQNNNPCNHQNIAAALTTNSCGLLLRGPVRDFELTDHDPPDAANLANETPFSLLRDVDYYAVCQVRDPLDLVVSQFFSHGWIHRLNPSIDAAIRQDIQAGKISIYDYALLEFQGRSGFGEASILDKYRHLKRLSKELGSRCLILHYEEMVENYVAWAQRLALFIRPLADTKKQLLALKPNYSSFKRRGRFWFFGKRKRIWHNPLDYVEQEMRKEHIRSPFPGDHLNFLSPEEISSLRALERQASVGT